MNNQLFDTTGRRIINYRLKSSYSSPSKDVYLVQPNITCPDPLHRLHDNYCKTDITQDQFLNEADRIQSSILKNEQISNLFDGIHLPLVIPYKITLSGKNLKNLILAVSRSYKQCYYDRVFENCLSKDWCRNVKIEKNSRHKKLLDKCKTGHVIGWYFPVVLESFSLNAQREQMSTLPDNLILSGIDGIIAQIMYPNVLARDLETPHYDLSAFTYGPNSYSLFFAGGNCRLKFDYSDRLDFAYLDCSGGLFAF